MFSLLKEKFEHLFPVFVRNQDSCTSSSDSTDEVIGTERNPWQDDLYRLANRRRNIHEQPETSLTELAKSNQQTPVAQATKSEQLRGPDDVTGMDAKEWWGQAVATWNPLDGKNIDSIEKLRRPRHSRWFR